MGEFFKDHIKRYRKRPIYWLLQSSNKSYSIYLFHEKATADTLSLLRGNRYLGGRLNRLQQDQSARMKAAEVANRAGDRRAASQAQRDASQIAELIEELQEFDRRLEAATRVPIKDKTGRDTTARWEPELDDGVYINARRSMNCCPRGARSTRRRHGRSSPMAITNGRRPLCVTGPSASSKNVKRTKATPLRMGFSEEEVHGCDS